MSKVLPFCICEYQIIWTFEFGFDLPYPQISDQWTRDWNRTHSGGGFWHTFLTISINTTADVKLAIFKIYIAPADCPLLPCPTDLRCPVVLSELAAREFVQQRRAEHHRDGR